MTQETKYTKEYVHKMIVASPFAIEDESVRIDWAGLCEAYLGLLTEQHALHTQIQHMQQAAKDCTCGI
mgnify:CR=1 FL=1